MKLSRTVVYAIQATMELARLDSGGVPVPCSRLAAAGGMPERFLLQILRNLVSHGILESTRGVEGGYTLGRNAKDISILDVIEAVGGPVSSTLPFDGGVPPESKEKLERTFDNIATYTRRELEAIKLADLIPSKNGRKVKTDEDGDGQQP